VSDALGFDPCDLTRDGSIDLDDAAIFREVISGPGQEALFLPADLDMDFDSDLDDWSVLAAKITFGSCEETPIAIELAADGPVDLLVTDPEGNRESADFSEIFGGAWNELNVDGDPELEEDVQIVSPVRGEYVVTVSAEGGAAPDDTFTILASVDGELTLLASDVRIDEIPAMPYTLQMQPCASVVPGVSPWGLSVLLLSVVAAAFVMMRRTTSAQS